RSDMLRRRATLLHSGPICRNTCRDLSRPKGAPGATGRFFEMDDEGRSTGGLDPARDWSRPHRGRRGRSPYWRHGREEGDEPRTTYAALDLGTNNCRLLVARPSGHGFRVIDAFSRIIRLGEGISASGRISEAAIER